MTTLLLIHVVATWYMVGIIWFVQVNHYPLFRFVGADGFAHYQTQHTRLTTWIVAPGMLTEAGTLVWLVVIDGTVLPAWPLWSSAVLLAIVWISTFALQVPCHQRLERGFSPQVHRMLVQTNWIRTFAWTLRGFMVSFLLAHHLI